MITAVSVPSWVIAVKADAGVLAAEELADDRLVRAGGDRQELGQALHDAQHQGLQPTHRRAPRLRGRPGWRPDNRTGSGCAGSGELSR